MKVSELRTVLEAHPQTFPRFILPGGDRIPAHAHVTEIGHVTRRFIDCGGVMGKTETALLQTHVGNDTDHRLRSDRFAKILQLGDRVLPENDLELEVEYDCCVVAQYPILETIPRQSHVDIVLGHKRTQCLAQERRQAAAAVACCDSAACC